MVGAGEKLGLVVEAWTALIRGGNVDALTRLLDEQVTWRGLLPQYVCHNREEVMGLLERYRARPPRLTRLEAEEVADRVAVSVDGPDSPETDIQAAGSPRSLVFTFRGGKIVLMESFPNRDAAFAALANRD